LVDFLLQELDLVFSGLYLLPDFPSAVGEDVLLLHKVCDALLVLANSLFPIFEEFLPSEQLLSAGKSGSAQRLALLMQLLLLFGHGFVLGHVTDDLFGEQPALTP
jgi:hypothetical protein